MNIRWTSEASDELEAVRLQVLHASYSSSTANRLFHQLLDEADRLMIFPQGGKREPLLAHRTDEEFRSLVVHLHYKLVYFIDNLQ